MSVDVAVVAKLTMARMPNIPCSLEPKSKPKNLTQRVHNLLKDILWFLSASYLDTLGPKVSYIWLLGLSATTP